ncbi:16807_t:CDS:10, partial [Acaulospora colombiana]
MTAIKNPSHINDQLLNENDPIHVASTFKFLERGGDISQNAKLAYSKFLPYILLNYNCQTSPFLSRYSQFDRICSFAAIGQDEVKNGIKDNMYPKPPITSAMDIDTGYPPINNGDPKMMSRLVLQDIHDLTKSAKLFYSKSQNTVEKYCDFLVQNRLHFQYLRRIDGTSNLEYFLPIMLYKWDLRSLGIDYEFDYIEKLCREILTLDVVISAKVLKELQYSTRGLFQDKILARSALEIDPSATFSGLELFRAPQDFAFKCFYVMLKGVYSCNLTELIPARKILFLTERSGNGDDYKHIYPELLGLISANYPEIFDIESLLVDEDHEIRTYNNNLEEIAEQLILSVSTGLDDDSEESALAMKRLAALPSEVLYAHSDTLIIFLLPRLLDRMDFEILNYMSEVWLLLYNISPHEASLLFVNGLRGEQDRRYRFPELQIMLDPSLVFRIDGRVFRCPPLYKIFLRVLKFYMVGSRQRLLRIYQENSNKEEITQINLPLTIMEQETLLLSTVLEICISGPKDDEKEDTCMNWVHELINHEDPEKQMFGLRLAGQLCEVWPIFSIAKNFMLPAIKRKIMNPSSKVLSPEAAEVLPILVKLHNIFEHLRTDVVDLLR